MVRTVPGFPARMAAAAAQTQPTYSMPPKLSNGSMVKPTTAERSALLVPKDEIRCTEPWHNNIKFKLIFTKDFFKISRARLCWSCQVSVYVYTSANSRAPRASFLPLPIRVLAPLAPSPVLSSASRARPRRSWKCHEQFLHSAPRWR